MSRRFSKDDHLRVNLAVQQAEAGTSAEIVPVVAYSSGRYDRAEDIVGLWVAGVSISIAWLLFPLHRAEHGSWSAPSHYWQLVALLVAGFAGFALGALAGVRLTWLKRLFTPRVEMQEEVNRRAREAFFDKRLHHTQAASGVLLYVSLFERMAVVLADRGTLDKLGQTQVDELCSEFTGRLHGGDVIAAICETSASVGQKLSPLLPRLSDDVNELPDALVVID